MSEYEYGIGVDWGQKEGDKTCVTINRIEKGGVITILSVIYGEVAEYIAKLHNEHDTLKRESEWHKGELEWLQGAYPVAYNALVDMRKEYHEAKESMEATARCF